MKVDDTWICDFCGNVEAEIQNMIVGPNDVCICDECVRASVGVLIDIAKKAADGK